MITIRKLLCFFAAAALTTFALPSFAQTKIFYLTTTATTIPGPNTDLSVTWNNVTKSGGGSSVLNSVKLDIPAGMKVAIQGWVTKNGTTTTTDFPGTSDPPKDAWVNGPTQLKVSNFTGAGTNGTFTVRLKVSPTGGDFCTAGTLKGQAWTGNNFGGTPFVPNATNADQVAVSINCDGLLDCNPGTDGLGNFAGSIDPELADPTADSDFSEGVANWGLRRGYNTDGSCPVKIGYKFIFDPDNKQAKLYWDKAAACGTNANCDASFTYVVIWPPQSTVLGWSDFRPVVAWLNTSGTSLVEFGGDPAKVKALICLNDNYFNGAAGPLPQIPNDPYWYGQLPGYQPGQTAKMCTSGQGFTVNPDARIQWWTRIIDQSDGYVGIE